MRLLSTMGRKPTNKDEIEKNYSLDGLNIDGDLDVMLTQIEAFDAYLRKDDQHQIMNINLLFYGPPGPAKVNWPDTSQIDWIVKLSANGSVIFRVCMLEKGRKTSNVLF